jgi:hypothetical protein
MIPPKLPDQESGDIAKRKSKNPILLVVMVMSILVNIILGLIMLGIYFHIFNLANVVNGNG